MPLVWGADTSGGTQLTTVDNVTEEFFDTIDGSNAYQTQAEIIANSSGTPTDALIIAVYLTLDTTSHDWDDQAFQTFTFFPATTNDEKLTFILPTIFTWRIGCLSAGAVDTYTVDMNYRELTSV